MIPSEKSLTFVYLMQAVDLSSSLDFTRQQFISHPQLIDFSNKVAYTAVFVT